MRRLLIVLISALTMALGPASALAVATPPPVFSGDPDSGPAFVCVAVPIFSSAASGPDCPAGEQRIDNSKNSGGAIVYYLKEILKLLNGLIGGIIVLVLVLAGFQYISSVGDPTRVKDAKKRIANAITALILYMLMFAILNFLVPGGILS